LSNLRNNVSRNFGKDRETRSNRIKVANYQVIPSVSDKSLLLKASIIGEDADYKVEVRFTNVRFGNSAENGFVAVQGMDGNEYFVKQMTLSQTQAKVKCNCLDFYYRFAVWNQGKNSLEGDPPAPYIKKTDRAPVNPNKVAGACKHIMRMMTFLRGEGLVR
jgi:hypothetical protein